MKNELPFILYFNIDYEMYKEPLDENTAYSMQAGTEKSLSGLGTRPSDKLSGKLIM